MNLDHMKKAASFFQVDVGVFQSREDKDHDPRKTLRGKSQ